jgi:DNA primase
VDLEELINSIDIVEYISQFVDLEEKNGEYWGLSPFSDEKTPSFSVRRENNTFYCFSSGIGGNVFTFTKYYFKCTAKQAIDKLLEYIGADGKELTSFKKMSTVMMCKKFMKQKKKPKENSTKKYPNDCMNRYEEREDKLAVWESEGISRETLQEFQVKYDAFSNRLMYPIRNLNGDIVNIGGRTLAPDWKERKMRKYTYLSSWGEMSVIYGLFENMQYILEKHEIILFEGCKSVLITHTWGRKNCGALLTSHCNPAQMKILAWLGVRVVFALDKEIDIRRDHNINKLRQYVNIEYLCDKDNLLSEKDAPVDKGEEVFDVLYNSRIPWK